MILTAILRPRVETREEGSTESLEQDRVSSGRGPVILSVRMRMSLNDRGGINLTGWGTKATAALAGAALLLSLWGLQTGWGANRQADQISEQMERLQSDQAPPKLEQARADAVDIRGRPDDLPGPITRRRPETVVVHLETVEVEGKLQDGATSTYWTFNGTVPGPMIRARVGDTVEIHLKNSPTSTQVHSIDLHAVNGPGGGAVSTQVKPGGEKVFRFQALNPGLFVYHCASPHIPTHIAMGMYGMILIEPAEGLPQVDHEFYLMQGERYTTGQPGTTGHHEYNGAALLAEQPSFVLFNGAYQALTGEVFDTLHREGGSAVDHNVQTTLIPSGGAAWMEFTIQAPGNYMLVDHAITRAVNKGAMAVITAEGPPVPEVYDGPVEPGSGH